MASLRRGRALLFSVGSFCRPETWASYRLTRVGRRPFRRYAHSVEMHDWPRLLRERYVTFTPAVNRAMYDGDAPRSDVDWAFVAVYMLNHEGIHQALAELAFGAADGSEVYDFLIRAEQGLDLLIWKHCCEWYDGAPWSEAEP